MKKITRSKERVKQTGEVFTPLLLVDEILDKLPKESFTDPTKTFLEPACGDGNFLIRLIAYKIHNGSTAEQALSTTYGLDIMEDNIAVARQRVLTHAYWSDTCKNKLNEANVADHLTKEDEIKIGRMKGHDEFCRQYEKIVERNILCRNALEYDMSFPSLDSSQSELDDKIDTVEQITDSEYVNSELEF